MPFFYVNACAPFFSVRFFFFLIFVGVFNARRKDWWSTLTWLFVWLKIHCVPRARSRLIYGKCKWNAFDELILNGEKKDSPRKYHLEWLQHINQCWKVGVFNGDGLISSYFNQLLVFLSVFFQSAFEYKIEWIIWMFHRFSFSSSSLKGRSVFVSLNKICIFIKKKTERFFFLLSKWNRNDDM